mmetsp:Transcript_40037/g.96678  ORF Transcript_40037/g.96678 Transcript_40037/m.96678 type:complete len:106 (-) Transcript_40037:28-345(-)
MGTDGGDTANLETTTRRSCETTKPLLLPLAAPAATTTNPNPNPNPNANRCSSILSHHPKVLLLLLHKRTGLEDGPNDNVDLLLLLHPFMDRRVVQQQQQQQAEEE